MSLHLRVGTAMLLLCACGDDDGMDAGDAATDSSSDVQVDVGSDSLTLRVLSGRADMVTGDDALVLVETTAGDAEGLELYADGDLATVHPFLTPDQRIARVEGLTPGEHTLEARLGDARRSLVITVYPRTGPVFSGPHEEPFVCSTEEFALGTATDADCSAPTVLVHFYKRTDGSFEPLATPDTPPADAAMTTTLDGIAVPFVLAVEAGTLDRAIYWIATLHDPESPGWEPWARPRTWNGKVIALFGGGCGTGYAQGDPGYAQALNDAVGVGFALMHSSLNVLGQNCNDVLSAEALMMVKERFIETYGVPTYVMGLGGSGGAIQQHLIADNYPGLLDGLLTQFSYPDIWSVLGDIVDCALFTRYFDTHRDLWPGLEARRAATGFASPDTCAAWISILGSIFDPSAQCDARLPASLIYDPVSNPSGARCTLQDHNINIFGSNEAGFARRAWSNEGVQYGLAALEAGDISAAQFLDLNESIGSFDIDGQPTPARDPGDDEAVRRAYATGRVLDGGQGLGDVPILDVRSYTDALGDIHDSIRTASTRARLDAANGDHDNQVSFIATASSPEPGGQAGLDALLALDQWLSALAADPDPDRSAAVRRTRPSGLQDRCYETTTPRDGPCTDVFPAASTPRLVAGAPIAADILQCALTPVDPADYTTPFTTDELTRLRTIFPRGVCDWGAAPPNRVPHGGPWQRF